MKKIVAIREQGDSFLAYFFEQRTTIQLNKLGAEIIEAFLNEGKTADEIAESIANEYGINKEVALNDTRKYLAEIYKRITSVNINEAEQAMLDRPLGVEIEITTACNLRCKHCFQGEYPEKYMTLKKFKNIVDILEKNEVYEINLVGGEIFKHKEIFEMLQYLNSKNMAVTIVTNAVAIDERAMKILKEMDNLYVLVSLDGTRNLHDQIRGEGQFDKIIPKILKMHNLDMNVEILCTINAINVDYVKEIAELGEKIEIPVNFNLFKPFSQKHEYLIVNPDKFFKALEELLRLRVKEHYRIGISNASLAAYMLGMPEKNECTATMA